LIILVGSFSGTLIYIRAAKKGFGQPLVNFGQFWSILVEFGELWTKENECFDQENRDLTKKKLKYNQNVTKLITS
jgi:hypothetical protein